MKTKLFTAAFAALCLTRLTQAQPTAFTYQGKLVDDCCPASGYYDMRFRLYPAGVGGSQVPGTVTISSPAIFVTNGLFTTHLNFGSAPFDGSPYWLEIDVRTNNVPPYVTLLPRTELTSTPYAIRALTAGNLTGLRVEANATSPNLVGGYSGNSTTPGVVGATISGGGDSAAPNRVCGDYATISGGKGHTACGDYSTVSGGLQNTNHGYISTIGGGIGNTCDIHSRAATIAGGTLNRNSGDTAVIGGE